MMHLRPPLARRLAAHANKSQRGFTLIEIVVAIVLLAVGIMGVIALFILGMRSNEESLRMTRSAIVMQDVHDAMVNAMKYGVPTDLDGGGIGPNERLMRFELPHSLQPDDNPVVDEEPVDDPDIINGFYFVVDDTLEAYTANPANRDNEVLDLPFEAVDDNNATIAGSPGPQFVWWYRVPPISAFTSADFDQDDARRFAFRIELRRSVEITSSGYPKAGDLFVCRVYVYKQFFERFDGMGMMTFQATLQDASNVPIFTGDFYIPGS